MKIKKLKLKFRENFFRKYYSLNRRRNWRWKLQQLFRSNISKQSQRCSFDCKYSSKIHFDPNFFFFFFEKGIFIFERVKFNSSELINRSTSLIVIPARAYSSYSFLVPYLSAPFSRLLIVSLRLPRLTNWK